MLELNETDGKIISAIDARLFNVTGIVAILDSPYLDYQNATFTIGNPIVVNDSAKKKVGFANVFIKNNSIIGELSMDYHMPERLDIEAAIGVYLAPHGFVVYEDSRALDLYGKPRKVLKLVLTSLSLSYRKPSDPRIEPLGTLVLI